jgi:hypothetical protein
MRANVDIDRLRQDMLNDCYGAFYGGGYGGAMYSSFEIERAGGQELVDLAQRLGYSLLDYIIGEPESCF